MERLDLNGTWQIRHDPFNAGLVWRWPTSPPEEGWRVIQVPSAWQSVLGMAANGVAWYRRTLPREVLDWATDELTRVRLRFDSVATDCRAWVNGVEVGRHVGDYLPFDFDITEALRAGKSSEPTLIVRVDQVHAPRPVSGTVTENGHVAKGFHDVLSAQHAGIWCGVSLRRTGVNCAVPDGVRVLADPKSRRVRFHVELAQPGHLPAGTAPPAPVVTCSVFDPDGDHIGGGLWEGQAGQTLFEFDEDLDETPALWSPDSPALYTLKLDIGDAVAGRAGVFEHHELRFGFRTIETGGPDNRRILLNGSPLLLRGVLHWGHEPYHIAPAPPPAQVREEFARLRALGFNCVCLCMVYMPEHFYEIADETGMLIWQEHPLWKARLDPLFHVEYVRHFARFMRRDARHPSVVLVSATCEHEALDPEFAAAWWNRAKETLSDRLLQTQTAFLAWTDPQKTDLHDEHVYDSTGRWAGFLEDIRAATAGLPPKPFVMGETIIANHWPDIDLGKRFLVEHAASGRPWFFTRGFEECAAFEERLASDRGVQALARFRRRADRWARQLRRSQCEMLRADPANAGWVMNHVRDVPVCRCGFKDDYERWRFEPGETRAYLSDRALLLRTPEWLGGFAGGTPLVAEVGVSNFSRADFAGEVSLLVGAGEGREAGAIPLAAGRGEVVFAGAVLELPRVEEPRRLRLEARAEGSPSNAWDLWILPEPRDAPHGAARLGGLEFTAAEREPEFEERAYSSGWGLACRAWSPRLPDTRELAPGLRAIDPDGSVPSEVSVLLTHRLTAPIAEYLNRGGRVVLLASRHAGSIPSRFVNLYAGVPLVPESPMFGVTDGEWVCDLLRHDLTQRSTRGVAAEELKIGGAIEPIVRLVQTHDSGLPRPVEMAFAARVGSGALLVSTLDHSTAAGRYVLGRMLEAARSMIRPATPALDISRWIPAR